MKNANSAQFLTVFINEYLKTRAEIKTKPPLHEYCINE